MPLYQIIKSSLFSALPKAIKTVWWLLKLILPVSLLVTFLQYLGVVSWVASWLSPCFSLLGLPGESAVVFISSLFLPLYGPVAIVATMSLTIRQTTILAIMCLISHNMFVETAIQRKTGSSAIAIFGCRIVCSFIAAFVLNFFLPQSVSAPSTIAKLQHYTDLVSILSVWLSTSLALVLKIIVIVTSLIFLQNLLRELKIIDQLSRCLSPLMRIMGLSERCTFLWLVAQTLGLTYGAVVMMDELGSGSVTRKELDMLNYHIAVNHSLLEDTMLFVAIGVAPGWITLPRVLLAILLVWFRKTIFSLGCCRKENKQPFPENVCES